MSEVIASASCVLARQDHPGDYALLRVAVDLAEPIQPGQALWINAVRWPVLYAAPEQGWVDCLQRNAPRLAVGDAIQATGPAGEPFALAAATPRALLLADGEGVASIAFLARVLRNRQPRVKPFALFNLNPPLPFRPQPSRIMTPGLPAAVIAALPLLEDWGIPSRIACPLEAQPGCFEGGVAELARSWLDVSQGVADVTIFACGDAELLDSAWNLADVYRLRCQTRPAHP